MLSLVRSRSAIIFSLLIFLLLLLFVLILTTTTIVSIRAIAVVGSLSLLFFAARAILLMLMFFLFLFLFAWTLPIPIVALFVPVLFFLFVIFVFDWSRVLQFGGLLGGIRCDGGGFVFFFFFVDGLLYEFEANPESVDFSPESEEALMYFSFQMHLYPLLSIVDSLNSTAHLANLYEEKHTF